MNAGNYNVLLMLKDGTNYKWSDNSGAIKILTFTIDKATANTVTVALEDWAYGETAKTGKDTCIYVNLWGRQSGIHLLR